MRDNAPRTVTIDPEKTRDWIWPLGIVVGLLLVMSVNAVFIYVAVSGADEVVESYATEER